MRRTTMPVAIAIAALLGLFVATPAGAATTGTICGQVSEFEAPVGGVSDGSMIIDGTVEVIDADAVISASTITVLTTVAAADATTCLEIVANGGGTIVELAIAAQAEICGDVTLDTTTGVYAVGGLAISADVVSADAELAALLDAAIAADASVCLDVTISATTGLITTASLSATLTLCGEVTFDADSVVIGGVDVPLSLLDVDALAVLAVAVESESTVCIQLIVQDTEIVQANLSAEITLCGEVALDAEGNAVVDGATIDAALLDAGAQALLELAASADGAACASVVAVSSNGDTSATVGVTIEVCAEVTAIGEGTITLNGVTLGFAGAADSDIEVGDLLCVTAATGPIGDPVVTSVGTDDGTMPDDDAMLPDTAMGSPAGPVGIGAVLLVLATVIGAAVRRLEGPMVG